MTHPKRPTPGPNGDENAADGASAADGPDAGGSRVIVGGSLHEAFQRDVQRILEAADLSEEDRQRILTGMSCPCCGGGASLVVPLKPPKED